MRDRCRLPGIVAFGKLTILHVALRRGKGKGRERKPGAGGGDWRVETQHLVPPPPYVGEAARWLENGGSKRAPIFLFLLAYPCRRRQMND